MVLQDITFTVLLHDFIGTEIAIVIYREKIGLLPK
jgi:hypothetical protein